MYQNNIYIDNHEEVAAMGGDIGVCLDKYDAKHGLAHNDLARAQYECLRDTNYSPEDYAADWKKYAA